MKHYYLVSSLPTLVLGEAVPFDVNAFRFSCIGVLIEDDLRELDLLLAGRSAEGQSAFNKEWSAVEAQLRNATARVRATRLGIDARNYLRDHPGFNTLVEKAVADAFAKATPLEREWELDRCRWIVLEELALRDAFGLMAVMAFAAKLAIAVRWASLKDETGRKRVEELVGQVKSQGEPKPDKEL